MHTVFIKRMLFSAAMTLGLFVLFPNACQAVMEEEANNIEIYKKASPGVVNITTIVVERDYFLRPIPREGTGSGAVIDTQGHILTNNHVIKDAKKIEVTLSDGSKWKGELVGKDPDNDLAVIRIDASIERLKPIPLGDSKDLMVGQKVLAIGNPFGLGETLTTGIISSLGRSIRSENGTLIEDLIQTDAAINPGNSGGPLLDSGGRIIGINTAIISPGGGSVGIGFAIPVDTATRIIPDLIEKGYVAYPWLGVTLFPLLPGMAQELGLSVDRGAMIVEVIPGGPADKAGFLGGTKTIRVGNALLPVGGDVILGIDDEPVTSSDDLIRAIRKRKPGDRVAFQILRNGQVMNIDVILGERPRR